MAPLASRKTDMAYFGFFAMFATSMICSCPPSLFSASKWPHPQILTPHSHGPYPSLAQSNPAHNPCKQSRLVLDHLQRPTHDQTRAVVRQLPRSGGFVPAPDDSVVPVRTAQGYFISTADLILPGEELTLVCCRSGVHGAPVGVWGRWTHDNHDELCCNLHG